MAPFLNLTLFENHQNCLILIFQFWHFLLKLTCLVALFDSSNWTIFGIFNELLSTQNVNIARFARNIKWDFFYDFQTMWVDLNFSPFRNLWSPESNLFSLEVSCPQNQLFALSLGILELSVRCLDRYSDTNVNMDIEVFCASIRCRKKDYILYYTQWRFVFGLKEIKTS